VLVYHDLLGLQDWLRPKFVRRYANLHSDSVDAVSRFASDVRGGTFPSSDETDHVADDLTAALRREEDAAAPAGFANGDPAPVTA
jgi:3-methyl-2-oxobutanoate hydroxymethyltransferase